MSQKAIDIIKPALKRVMVDGTGYEARLGDRDVLGNGDRAGRREQFARS